MDFTKIYKKLKEIKIKLHFHIAIIYSLQIGSILVYPKNVISSSSAIDFLTLIVLNIKQC